MIVAIIPTAVCNSGMQPITMLCMKDFASAQLCSFANKVCKQQAVLMLTQT